MSLTRRISIATDGFRGGDTIGVGGTTIVESLEVLFVDMMEAELPEDLLEAEVVDLLEAELPVDELEAEVCE